MKIKFNRFVALGFSMILTSCGTIHHINNRTGEPYAGLKFNNHITRSAFKKGRSPSSGSQMVSVPGIYVLVYPIVVVSNLIDTPVSALTGTLMYPLDLSRQKEYATEYRVQDVFGKPLESAKGTFFLGTQWRKAYYSYITDSRGNLEYRYNPKNVWDIRFTKEGYYPTSYRGTFHTWLKRNYPDGGPVEIQMVPILNPTKLTKTDIRGTPNSQKGIIDEAHILDLLNEARVNADDNTHDITPHIKISLKGNYRKKEYSFTVDAIDDAISVQHLGRRSISHEDQFRPASEFQYPVELPLAGYLPSVEVQVDKITDRNMIGVKMEIDNKPLYLLVSVILQPRVWIVSTRYDPRGSRSTQDITPIVERWWSNKSIENDTK